MFAIQSNLVDRLLKLLFYVNILFREGILSSLSILATIVINIAFNVLKTVGAKAEYL